MNINKFTQKSMEAVQNCEKLAYEYGNQQIEQEHLFYSLLKLDDSLILKLLTKMGISKELIMNEAEQKVAGLPKVSGGGQVYISNDLNNIGTFLMQKSIKTPLHLSKVSFTKRNIAFDIYKYRIIRLFDTISCILTIFDEMR